MKFILTFIAFVAFMLQAQADTNGIRPTSLEPLLPETYLMETVIEYSQEELDCMVTNLYHEARGEGFAGMYAVAMVVLNRVEDDRYPDTVCGVVQQGPVDSKGMPKRHRCQFSWWCDGKSDTMNDTDSFLTALGVAELIMINAAKPGPEFTLPDVTEGATHYHTTEVKPNWRNDRGMARTGIIGSHIFYRWG